MIKRLIGGAMVLLVLATIFQCSKPDENLSLEEADLIAANYDEDAVFGNLTTFYVADSVRKLNKDGEWEWSDEEIDWAMRDEVIAQMKSRGYTHVTDKAEVPTTDMGIQISRVNTLTVGTGITPCYWPGWGWGGYWPCYGCGGYYPGGCSYTYSYQTGSVLLEMIDIQNPIEIEGEEKYKVIWYSGMNGILSSSTSNDAQRALRGVKTCFEISPYIQKIN